MFLSSNNFVQKEAWSDPKGVPAEEGYSVKDSDSGRKELGLTSAGSAELQVHTS